MNILCTEKSRGPVKDKSGDIIRFCQKAYVPRGCAKNEGWTGKSKIGIS